MTTRMVYARASVLAATALAALPAHAFAQCLQGIIEASGTMPGPPTPPPSTWSTGNLPLYVGSVTCDCGGAVISNAFIQIGGISNVWTPDGTPQLVSGSIDVRRRQFDGIVPPGVFSPPSRLEAGDAIIVGAQGELTIRQSGWATSSRGFIGILTDDRETGTEARVTIDGGPNVNKSRWEILGGELVLGGQSHAPQSGIHSYLTIENGGVLRVAGLGSLPIHANGAEILVTGSGSELRNETGPILLGANTVARVQSGGLMAATGDTNALGYLVLHRGAALTVTGAGSLVQLDRGLSMSEAGSLTISHGAQLTGGANVAPNDAPELSDTLIGTYIVASGETSNRSTVTVTGSGSLLTQARDLYVGYWPERFATLQILDGARVEDRNGGMGHPDAALGYQYATQSDVLVRGAGSHWQNHGDLTIGTSGGQVTVDQGGLITNVNGTLRLGTVTVTGASSRWDNSGNLFVEGNAINVTAAGQLNDVNGTVSGGIVTVDGLDSRWNNLADLTVTGGEIRIQNSGEVLDNNGKAAGYISIVGLGARWTNRLDFTVGHSGRFGEVVVSAGGLITNRLGIVGTGYGQGSYSNGRMIVTGSGSQWQNAADVWVGQGGAKGLLQILDGGAVSALAGFVSDGDGDNDVLIDGAGSTWSLARSLTVGIGQAGAGLVNGGVAVANGGTLASHGGKIGSINPEGYGGTGSVTVSGSGSHWINSDTVEIGAAVFGQLTVQAGGTVTGLSATPAGPAVVGGATTTTGGLRVGRGTLTVDGAGSTFSYNGPMHVGVNTGTGTVNITGGGRVSTGAVMAAEGFSQMGNTILTVTGQGSRWDVGGDFSLSTNLGFGTLNVNSGGTLNIDGNLSLATNSGNGGTLNIDSGGTVKAGGTLTIGSYGQVNLGVGATLDVQAVSFQSGGQFRWNSGTLHVGTFSGNLVNQGGTLAPGHSAGTTAVAGNYTQQAGAALEIEIGGTGQGTQFDFVNVTGNALLAGELRLTLIDGFIPDPAQTFAVFAANTLAGVFTNVDNGRRLATSDGGGSFLVHYGPGSTIDPTQIVLSDFVRVVPSDFDQDGDVDLTDFQAFQGCFNGPNRPYAQPNCAASDFDADNDVDLSDFQVFQACFNGPNRPPTCE